MRCAAMRWPPASTTTMLKLRPIVRPSAMPASMMRFAVARSSAIAALPLSIQVARVRRYYPLPNPPPQGGRGLLVAALALAHPLALCQGRGPLVAAEGISLVPGPVHEPGYAAATPAW